MFRRTGGGTAAAAQSSTTAGAVAKPSSRKRDNAVIDHSRSHHTPGMRPRSLPARDARERLAGHRRHRRTAGPRRRRSGRFRGPCPRSPEHRRLRSAAIAATIACTAIADSMAPGAAARIARRISAGVLAARIVVGDIDAIGKLGRELAHQRPLAAVAIAAGAEHDREPPLGMRPQRAQHRRQRVRRMGVIDKDRRAGRGLCRPAACGPGTPRQLGSAADCGGKPAPPVASTRPSAASTFIAWKAPTNGRSIHAARRTIRSRCAARAGAARGSTMRSSLPARGRRR